MNPTLQQIVDDLTRIVDSAKWAYTHGLWKAGHGLAAEHGTDLSQPEHKRLEGPTYDLQIGDHKAREAYQKACVTVMLADVTLAALLQGPQPEIRALTIYATTVELEHSATTARWRAHHITTITGHTRPLSHLRRQLDATIRDLSKAMDAGPADGIAHNEKTCKTCGIRPQAERAKPDGTMRAHKSGECDTCANYRHRNGAQRDPKKHDVDPTREARSAQARRLARGEGWGAA